MKQTLAIVYLIGTLVGANTFGEEWNGDPLYPVIVYNNPNAKGDMHYLSLGIYPEIDFFLEWEKGISSIHLMDGYEIMCYSFLSFQGERYHLSSSSMNIEKEAGFRSLSIKIIKTKEPEACTNFVNFRIPDVDQPSKEIRLKAEEKFWNEANSFCSSCGEQIGVDFEKSSMNIQRSEFGSLKVAGTVNCLCYSNSSFFETQGAKARFD